MPWIAILSGLTKEPQRGEDQGMEQDKGTRGGRKGKHLNKEERVVIERMSRGEHLDSE